MEITGDPLPYGIAPNRKTLDTLVRHALAQHIIKAPVAVEQLFAPGTERLVA
jgi:4,5-dihydroxyphthalate decarboxylase